MAFSYRLVTRSGDRTPFGARSRGNTRAFSGAAREARSRAEAGAGGAAARGFPSSPPLVTSKVSTPVGPFFVTRSGDRTLSPSPYSKWSRKSHLARSICNLNGIICFIWKGVPRWRTRYGRAPSGPHAEADTVAEARPRTETGTGTAAARGAGPPVQSSINSFQNRASA